MGSSRQDLVVRFIGDTDHLVKGTGVVNARLQTVATSLKGIATAGAAVGAISYFSNAIAEAREAARVTRQTENVLRSTGGVANVTAKEVSDLAERLSELAGVDDELVQSAENVLLTFGKVRNEFGAGNDVFSQATELALDMSAALGTDLQGATIQVGKALNDPIKGVTALARAGVSFTAQQKEQIKSLVESGDLLGAQKLILGELKTEFGGMAAASADSGDKLRVAWDNLSESVGQKLLPAFNAVATWALEKGVPALGNVARTAGDVLEPAFDATVDAGKSMIGMWRDLPTPIQAGIIAMTAWKLVQDRVEGGFGRMSGPIRSFGSDVRTVMQASQGDVGRFGASLQVLQDRSPAIGAMGAAFRSAKGDVEGFAATARGTGAAAISGLKSAAGGLIGALGGPWGIAIAGAALGLGLWIQKQQEAKAAAQEHAAKVRALTQEIVTNGGVVTAQTKLQTVQEAHAKGLFKRARELGVSYATMTQAVLGNRDAIAVVNKAWDESQTKTDANTSAMGRFFDGLTSGGGGLAGLGTGIAAASHQGDGLRNTFGELSGRMIEAGEHAQLSKERLAEIGVTIDETGGKAEAAGGKVTGMHTSMTMVGDKAVYAMNSTEMLKEIVEGVGIAFDAAKDEGHLLAEAIRAIDSVAIASIDTQEAYEESLDRLTESIKTNGATLDIHTEKGRNNRDALEAVATNIRDMTLADLEAGVPMQEAIQRHDARVAALQREADKTGFSKAEAEKLISTYSRIPKEVRTQIETKGYEETMAKLAKMSSGQFLLAQGLPLTESNLRAVQKERRFGEMAQGGPVHGPGTKTSDSIPTRLSVGEYVQRASAVDYYGVGFMNAINQKRFPKMLTGYAEGGMVWPFPVDVTKTKIPDPGPIAALQRFAMAQRGKTYLWGATGPNNYDCSGLVGALWALARGMNPHQRHMTTATMGVGRYGFKPGPGRFTVYLGPGHTAANVGGLHAEAYGGNGTPLAIGRIGTPLSFYTQVMHLFAKGGLVALKNSPAKRMESFREVGWPEPMGFRGGGLLMPGQLGYNETSRPERILNDQQWDAMGKPIVVNLTIQGPVGSQRELEDWLVKAVDKLKSRGRIK